MPHNYNSALHDPHGKRSLFPTFPSEQIKKALYIAFVIGMIGFSIQQPPYGTGTVFTSTTPQQTRHGGCSQGELGDKGKPEREGASSLYSSKLNMHS